MKSKIIYLIIFLNTISCGNPDLLVQKEKLEGYWEIKSVEMPDGSQKDFAYSTVIDFISISEEKGIRTKVSPQLDGSFISNGNAEKFSTKIEEGKLMLYYETPFDHWKETVLVATDSTLKIINRDAKVYKYKKFIKFSISD